MAEPFLSETRLFSFVFAPKGWALCNGQFLPINQNQALFSLLGTTYGGNGQTTFALPDLRGKVPIHAGNGHTLGETGGAQSHTLSVQEMPTHSHAVIASNKRANLVSPAIATFGQTVSPMYSDASPGGTYETVSVVGPTLSNIGGSQAHLNMQPFLTLSFCIALQGIFPSQN
jgi:microcystin-dependent protein